MVNVFKSDINNIINYLKEGYPEEEIEIIDFENTSLAELVKNFFSNSLLEGSKNLVVINPMFLVNKTDALKKKEVPLFESLIQKNSSSDNAIYFVVGKDLNMKIPYVKDNRDQINYKVISKEEGIENFIKQQGIKINNADLAYLLEKLGKREDIEGELIKLHMYAEKGQIDKETIDTVITVSPEENVFNFIGLLLENKKQDAYKMYKEKIKNLGYENEQLLAIIGSQIKFVTQVQLLGKNRTNDEIARILKVSPYRVKMVLPVARKIKFDELQAYYEKLSWYDYVLKSGRSKEEDVILNFFI